MACWSGGWDTYMWYKTVWINGRTDLFQSLFCDSPVTNPVCEASHRWLGLVTKLFL